MSKTRIYGFEELIGLLVSRISTILLSCVLDLHGVKNCTLAICCRRGFWSEVQRVYENRICTSLPSSLRIAWNGVLKPRHFLGVRLAVRMMSWLSSSDTLSMSI